MNQRALFVVSLGAFLTLGAAATTAQQAQPDPAPAPTPPGAALPAPGPLPSAAPVPTAPSPAPMPTPGPAASPALLPPVRGGPVIGPFRGPRPSPAPVSPPGPGEPRIEFAEKDFIFPTTFVGEKITHAFTFTNKGSGDLIIRKVDTSCGCTVSKIGRSVVPAGETGSIELTMDTSEKMGNAVMVRGTVFSNDTREVAAGPCTSLLELKGEVVTCYKLMPTGAYFGQMVRSQGPKTVELKAAGVRAAEQGYKILSIETPASWVKVEPRALEPKELSADSKSGWAFRVTVMPTVPLGDYIGHIVVHTDCAKQPVIRFPIIGIAHGSVKAPDNLILNRVRRGEEVERIAPIERADGTAGGIPIIGIDYDKTRFDITTEVAIAKVRTDLRIKIKKTAPPGPFCAQILVRLNDASMPLLRINCYGEIVARVQPDPTMGLIRPAGEPIKISLPIEGPGAITAAAVEPADAGFEVELKPAADGTAAFVLVKPKGALAADTHAELVITTDVSGEEKLRIPLIVAAP